MLPRAKKKKKSHCTSSVVWESKEMDERRANSAFRQEVHRGRGFAFIETHCLHQPAVGERYWESQAEQAGDSKSQRTGNNYRHTKTVAVVSASDQLGITNKHKQSGQIAALITGLIVAHWRSLLTTFLKKKLKIKKAKQKRMSSQIVFHVMCGYKCLKTSWLNEWPMWNDRRF